MGGNVFKDTVPFDHSRIGIIRKHLDAVLEPLGSKVIPIGSTATPTVGKTSGDYDVIVDETALMRVFNEKNPRMIRKNLQRAFADAGETATLNGMAVHVKVPDGDKFYQADVLVVPNAAAVSKFHIHNIPTGSKYKGVHKHLALMYLAKRKGLLWSAFQGLFNRNSEGKRGDFITADLDTIAYLLIGVDATEKDLGSFESIVSALLPDEAATMIKELQEDPSWKEPL